MVLREPVVVLQRGPCLRRREHLPRQQGRHNAEQASPEIVHARLQPSERAARGSLRAWESQRLWVGTSPGDWLSSAHYHEACTRALFHRSPVCQRATVAYCIRDRQDRRERSSGVDLARPCLRYRLVRATFKKGRV